MRVTFVVSVLSFFLVALFLYFDSSESNTYSIFQKNESAAPVAQLNPTSPAVHSHLEKRNSARSPASGTSMHQNVPAQAEDFEERVLTFADHIPRLETIREQVKENPHGTPRALIEFAKSMAPLMEEARKELAKAEFLFWRLEKCALSRSGDVPTQIQSFCMQNMKELSKYFPTQLSEAYNESLSGSSEELVEFTNFMGN